MIRLFIFLVICFVGLSTINPASAAIIDLSAYNYARAYGEFSYDTGFASGTYSPYDIAEYNYDLNSYATAVSDYGQFGFPYISGYAYASNYTDGGSFITTHSITGTYADPNSLYGGYAYSYVSAQSNIYFTLTERSTAELYLDVYASTNDPGVGGDNVAQAIAELYNFGTGGYYIYEANSVRGGSFSFATTIPVILEAGQYMVSLSYSYGRSYSYNGFGTASESTNAVASLSFIKPVPEPSSFALLGLGSLGLAFDAYRRRRIAVKTKGTGPECKLSVIGRS